MKLASRILFTLCFPLVLLTLFALPYTASVANAQGLVTSTPQATLAPTAEPVTQDQAETVTGNVEDNPIDIPAALTIIVSVIGLFASLPGVALLQSALVNIGKSIGIVTDGNAPRAYALLTLILFVVLVYFQIFRHAVDLAALDSALGQIGTIAAFVGVSVTSLVVGPRVHVALVGLSLPGVSASYTTLR